MRIGCRSPCHSLSPHPERVEAGRLGRHRVSVLERPMTADQVIRLVTALAGMLGVVVWPALVLFLAIRFRAALSDFVSHLGEFSFKAPGLEATGRRQQVVEAAAALGAA